MSGRLLISCTRNNNMMTSNTDDIAMQQDNDREKNNNHTQTGLKGATNNKTHRTDPNPASLII